jgi:hypothetical protein
MEAPALLGFDTQDIQACLGVGKNKTEGNSSGQKAVGHVKKELSGAGTVVEVDQTRDTHLEELLRELRRCIAHKHVYVLAFAFHAIPPASASTPSPPHGLYSNERHRESKRVKAELAKVQKAKELAATNNASSVLAALSKYVCMSVCMHVCMYASGISRRRERRMSVAWKLKPSSRGSSCEFKTVRRRPLRGKLQ